MPQARHPDLRSPQPSPSHGERKRTGPGRRFGWVGLVLALMVADPVAMAFAQTGLPIPRFVSLRSVEVNLRSGPGQQYPIQWVYRRVGLPVEITAEFDVWRRIRDQDGIEGWVHQSLLSGRRFAIIAGDARVVITRRAPADSGPVAQLEPGVIASLLECPISSTRCRVEVEGYGGWLERDDLWGVYEDEVVE